MEHRMLVTSRLSHGGSLGLHLGLCSGRWGGGGAVPALAPPAILDVRPR